MNRLKAQKRARARRAVKMGMGNDCLREGIAAGCKDIARREFNRGMEASFEEAKKAEVAAEG